MKFFKAAIFAFSLLQAATGFAADSSATGTSSKTVIIDVRTAAEFKAEHLEGALNIPYDKIAETIQTAVPDKNSKLILYCRTGRRSGIALDTLKSIGYEDVTNLKTIRESSEKLGIPVIKGVK